MTDLTVERHDHVVVVTLNRPPVNAVTGATLAEITSTFDGLGRDRDIRAIVFTATGQRAFMAGLDLSTVGDTAHDQPVALLIDPPASPETPCGPSPTARFR